MIKVYPDSKIYVYCPAGVVTGGAELLHQLVSFLNDNGKDAYIVYFGEKDHILPSDYKCYNVKITEQVINTEKNIEVIYEGIFDFVFHNELTQKFLWWLSVDNFYRCSTRFLSLIDLFRFDFAYGFDALAKRIYIWCFRHKDYPAKIISISKLKKLNVVNGYQSEYAQNFLQNHGFKEMVALKDYINIEHFNHDFDRKNRKDIVLYNPKKGLGFTKKLIARTPDLHWIPIQGMSRQQVINLMGEAKLYVDFGFHPGKDRLPRECAVNGCCVVTGMRGSAAFFEDVMVPNKYKFDEHKSSLSDIVEIIRWTLKNYEIAIDDFCMYRRMIALEKKEFEEQISLIFLHDL